MRYGNNEQQPVISNGDLATYRTTGAGPVKVKVLAKGNSNPPYPFEPKPTVTVRVTDRSNPYYRTGEVHYVSPLWLDKRG